MQPVTRAAIAVSAGLLMIGGAGTLSFWTDDGTAEGLDLTTGEISISEATCAGAWQLGGADLGTTDQLVPGDVLTRSCTFTVTMEGKNASATLDVADPTFDGTSSSAFVAQLDASATYTIGDPAVAVPATLTAAHDGETVTAALEVEFKDLGDPADAVDELDPAENQNLTNSSGLAAALEDVTVTLTQS